MLRFFVRKGKFSQALDLVSVVGRELFRTVLQAISSKKDITAYAFVWILIYENESAFLHDLAAELFLVGFANRVGAHGVIFFHTHRAAELEPENIELQEKLLNLYEPGHESFDVAETKALAERVLVAKPNSQQAQRVFKLLK